MQIEPKSTAGDIAETIGVTVRQAERIRKELKEIGIIERVGYDKGGYWDVTL